MSDFVLGRNSLRFWYYRFKDSPYYSLSILLVTIVVCVLLLFKVIIPQVEQWFSIRNEVETLRRRVEVIKGNIAFMNNLDKGKLSSDLDIAMSALPATKDFGGILNAISASSLKAGVSLEDYSFQVGQVSSGSATPTRGVAANGLSPVRLTVRVSGTIDSIRNFLQEIEQKLPIAQVISMEADTKSSTIDIQFYQKPFPQIGFKDSEPLTTLPETNRLLLQRLAEWKNASVGIDDVLNQPVATSEALPLF
jgi:hypothetical protein